MKNSKSQMAISLAILLVCIALPFGQCLEPQQRNFITTTCKNTPSFDLCLKTLTSNPKSARADIKGLALIMVDAISSEARATLQRIAQLQKGSNSPRLAKCAKSFNIIVTVEMPEAVYALTKKGDPKYAQDQAAGVTAAADSCDKDMGKGSVLGPNNQKMRDLGGVARAIIGNLL